MPGFNRFIGIGHLTNHPELRYTTTGTPVLSGGFAMNRRFKQGDDLKEEVCFIDFTVWGKQAEVMGQYTAKGDPIMLEGRLTQRRWEANGQRHSKHEITVENFQLLKGKESQDGAT